MTTYNLTHYCLERHAAVGRLTRRGIVVDGRGTNVNDVTEGRHDLGDEDVFPLWFG